MSRRAARPVEIYYYPKKAAGGSTRRLQTVETVVTQAESSEPVTARSHRTLTDEVLDPAETAFTELMRLGHEAFRAGRVNEARVVFESLVSSGRAEPFAHTMLGTILLGAHELDAALEQFEAALALEPDELSALVYRAEIRLSKRKIARAIEDLERAVKLGPASDPFVGRAKKLLGLARANRSA